MKPVIIRSEDVTATLKAGLRRYSSSTRHIQVWMESRGEVVLWLVSRSEWSMVWQMVQPLLSWTRCVSTALSLKESSRKAVCYGLSALHAKSSKKPRVKFWPTTFQAVNAWVARTCFTRSSTKQTFLTSMLWRLRLGFCHTKEKSWESIGSQWLAIHSWLSSLTMISKDKASRLLTSLVTFLIGPV